jgi:hypothetical protein
MKGWGPVDVVPGSTPQREQLVTGRPASLEASATYPHVRSAGSGVHRLRFADASTTRQRRFPCEAELLRLVLSATPRRSDTLRASSLFRDACSRTTRSPLNLNTKANRSSTAISLAGPDPTVCATATTLSPASMSSTETTS